MLPMARHVCAVQLGFAPACDVIDIDDGAKGVQAGASVLQDVAAFFTGAQASAPGLRECRFVDHLVLLGAGLAARDGLPRCLGLLLRPEILT